MAFELSLSAPIHAVPGSYRRQVKIANLLTVLFSGVTTGIAAIFYYLFGPIDTLPYIMAVALLFLVIPPINRYISHYVGRVLFCLIPVVLTMFVTVLFKIQTDIQTSIVYFDSRLILMATPVLPGIVFRLEEKKALLLCMCCSMFSLVFYDPIHQFFGVGYFQKGFTDTSYYYINYISIITSGVLIAGILLLRGIQERSEKELVRQNRELRDQQQEIEAQKEELIQQQEELVSSREKLEEANDLITRQQEKLEIYNAELEALVAEKSQQLVKANDELVRHNNELLQFSYTVSHNLRGPVARMLGLTHLLKNKKLEEEKEQIENMIIRSSQELDMILKDLSMIIDIRNEVYRLREKVFLTTEWEKALQMLGDNVKEEYEIVADFSEAPYVFGVRPMIQSILYNLLSNAIKYQSPERPLQIIVRSAPLAGDKTLIEVKDNGLGIDLKNQKNNIFRLYKRFHSHVGGKGLGLYLVKTQVEALGGDISVESESDAGAQFRIVFSQPTDVHRQVFYESEAARLYYDGLTKITVIEWKRHISSEEYRKTFEVVMNSLKLYKTPGWISDIRKQGPVEPGDQHWMVNTLIPEAVKYGLKRVAIVGLNEQHRKEYADRLVKAFRDHQLYLLPADSFEEAQQHMRETPVTG